ncbi:hypothetical protein ACOMHN_021584 [Nucella lapillus]
MPFPGLHFPQPQDINASTACGSGELQKEMTTAFRTARRDEALDAYSSTVLARVTAHAPQPPKVQNLNKKYKEALAKLRQMVQNRTIRISPADKGGAIVVQDYMQYQEEAYRQLDNSDQYERLPSDPTSEIAQKIQ